MKYRHSLTIALFTLPVLISFPAAAAPIHIYLTWQSNTATTMTLNIHTTSAETVSVHYDTVTQSGIPANYSWIQTGPSHQIPGLDAHVIRHIHTVELTGLTPGETYYAVAGGPTNGYSAEFKFRTIPFNEELRFIAAGDFGVDAGVDDMMIEAASHDPHFAVLGGDLAYADTNLSQYYKWDALLNWWEEHMVTPDGLMVPMVLAIGNHEVNGGYEQFGDPTGFAPFFFGYFAQQGAGFSEPRSAHFQRSFGPYVSIYFLDTGHVTPIYAQSLWMNQALQSDSRFFKFAVYHMPMYPSHRSFNDARNTEIRNQWRSIFDTNYFTACFENHEHLLKRTKRLTNDTPNSASGVLYLGDGGFGRPTRTGEQAQRLDDPGTFPNELSSLGLSYNYLAHWEATKHFWLVTVPNQYPPQPTDLITFEAYDANGTLLDSTQIPVGGVPAMPVETIMLIGSILIGGIVIARRYRVSKRGEVE